MEFFEFFASLVSCVYLGRYMIFIPLSIFILLSIYFFTASLLKRLRQVSKVGIFSGIISIYFLIAFKYYCDFSYGKIIHLSDVAFGLFFAFLTFSELTAIAVVFDCQTDFCADKRLIDRLLTENESKISKYFTSSDSENPFKRIDYLPTRKGFDFTGEENDFSINFSYLRGCVNELFEKPLASDEEEFLHDLEMDLEKFSLKDLSNYDRFNFSTKLSRLVKIMAKYDNANFDDFSA